MHDFDELKEMLMEEVKKITKKGELNAQNLEAIDKLLNSIKNACKITMYEEYADEGEYSQESGMSYRSGNSYARGRGRNAKRDSMGRYSRESGYSNENGYSNEGGYSNARGGRGGYSRRDYSYADGEKEEKINMLREMMNEVGSEEERKAINSIIRRMENE